MAVITKRVSSKGEISFRTIIRKKGVDITRTFFSEEEAKMFSWWKENLITNMGNYEVPIQERVTLEDIFQLKMESSGNLSRRMIDDIRFSLERVTDILGKGRFCHEISFDEWKKVVEKLSQTEVFKGSKNSKNARVMSVSTLRRTFACISSMYSNAISHGIAIENIPLKIIKTVINPNINNEKT